MADDNAIVTKYRPQDFKDVIGQEAVVKSLENSIKKKLGNAYLFTGPSGTGKTTLARITALALGCDPMDLIEKDAATETGIEEIRQLIESLMWRPMGDGIKGVIIDECHMLSKSANNGLLKSLEDPPSWVRWFLCTTEDNKIIKAIRTRCLHFPLKEVRVKDLVDLLLGTDEGKDVDDEILELCAEEAGGSPRQALSNLGVCMDAADLDEAQELLRSAAEAPAAFELARALLKGDSWRVVSGIIERLKETNPESVRHVVRAYMTSVLLKDDNPDAFGILNQFAQPFSSSDQMSPLVLACYKLTR
jgi:DNA polymerase III gamma/tau subunit